MVKIPRSIVPIIGEPDIDESYIRQQDVVLLKTLLIDRTMTALNRGVPVNIKWAVDDYANEYPDKAGYGCEEQITLDAISSRGGRDLKVVTPRVRKRKEEQERRTAQKAEVFTPSWICNEQYIEEVGSGTTDIFEHCASHGLEPPIFEMDARHVSVTVMRPTFGEHGRKIGQKIAKVGAKGAEGGQKNSEVGAKDKKLGANPSWIVVSQPSQPITKPLEPSINARKAITKRRVSAKKGKEAK